MMSGGVFEEANCIEAEYAKQDQFVIRSGRLRQRAAILNTGRNCQRVGGFDKVLSDMMSLMGLDWSLKRRPMRIDRGSSTLVV